MGAGKGLRRLVLQAGVHLPRRSKILSQAIIYACDSKSPRGYRSPCIDGIRAGNRSEIPRTHSSWDKGLNGGLSHSRSPSSLNGRWVTGMCWGCGWWGHSFCAHLPALLMVSRQS